MPLLPCCNSRQRCEGTGVVLQHCANTSGEEINSCKCVVCFKTGCIYCFYFLCMFLWYDSILYCSLVLISFLPPPPPPPLPLPLLFLLPPPPATSLLRCQTSRNLIYWRCEVGGMEAREAREGEKGGKGREVNLSDRCRYSSIIVWHAISI